MVGWSVGCHRFGSGRGSSVLVLRRCRSRDAAAAICHHQRCSGSTRPGRDRRVAREQRGQGVGLGGTGDQPQQAVGAGEARVGQGHSPSTLVLPRGRGHEAISDLEHRVIGYQRCGVAVGSEAQMHEVERLRAAPRRTICRLVRGRGPPPASAPRPPALRRAPPSDARGCDPDRRRGAMRSSTW